MSILNINPNSVGDWALNQFDTFGTNLLNDVVGNVLPIGIPEGTLPGQHIQTSVDNALYGPTAQPFDYDPTLDQQVANYADWIAQPGNLPQYYTGTTVADPSGPTQDAWARYTDAAGERDTLTNQLVSDYQAQLDPNSALNQQYAQNAANRAGSAFFGAGTPGSSRGLYASNVAAQDTYRDRRDKALAGLGAQRGELEKGADLLSRVGKEHTDTTQDFINEDIKRWNYYQTLPQQVQEQLLGASAIQTGLASEAGIQPLPNVGIDLQDAYGDLYSNTGGIQGNPMGMGAPMAPPPPAGIMGDPMMMDQTTVVALDEPSSEIDMVEKTLQALAMASDGEITIKRKSKKKGGK